MYLLGIISELTGLTENTGPEVSDDNDGLEKI